MDFSSSQQDRQKVEFFISCRSLKNLDSLSKSDPQVILYFQNPQNHKWFEQARTEIIKDNLNPNFFKTFRVDFIFEVQQPIKFEVIDIDSSTSFDFIGECETNVGKIVGSRNQVCILDILDKSKQKSGKLIIRAEKVGENREIFNCRISAKNLPDVHFFSKSSPFFRISKGLEDKTWLKVYESEWYHSNLSPVFKPFEIRAEKLCNGDHLRPLQIELYDHEDSGDHKFLSMTTFTLDQLFRENKIQFPLKDKKGKAGGEIHFDQKSLVTKAEFLDYLRGGVQLNLIQAIDFTGSNGAPSNPSSLHYIGNPRELNQYQQAILAVGEILLNYDYDKMVPVFGFGGKPRLPHFNFPQVLHCFPVTGYPQNPDVFGLEGIMGAYINMVNHVDLSGPTLFNPLIEESMKVAEANKQAGSMVYSILLILTDGAINDMNETISSIVKAAYLPMSIIIVGVGNGDFGAMETLDGDDGLIDGNGVKCKRDLVQFVPFNKYKNNPAALAKEVLAELPDQLVEYMRVIGKSPNPPNIVDITKMTLQTTVQPGPGMVGTQLGGPGMVGQPGGPGQMGPAVGLGDPSMNYPPQGYNPQGFNPQQGYNPQQGFPPQH